MFLAERTNSWLSTCLTTAGSPAAHLCRGRAQVLDGLKVDVDGNIWTSAADGVHCIAPDGELTGKIVVPETVTNLTFGGPKRNVSSSAASSLYAVYIGTRGL